MRNVIETANDRRTGRHQNQQRPPRLSRIKLSTKRLHAGTVSTLRKVMRAAGSPNSSAD